MYTLSSSFGSFSTVCVCDPRQVCTLAMYRGFRMSLMSKIRMPRSRSRLTASSTPSVPQSSRPPRPSPDTNMRSPYTETSLCDAGQTRPVTSSGWRGSSMSQTWMPL